MSIFRLFGVMSPAYTALSRLWGGAKKIGEDTFGNCYYQAKPRKGYSKPRRFVYYKGAPEATAVPPEWHGWLHHQTNIVPAGASADNQDQKSFRRPWQKPHTPNRTGTNLAYRPPGHVLAGGKRDGATGDYEAWTPHQNASDKATKKTGTKN
jgi:NADH:ubiquinone oxidoreductase subunit